MFTIKLTQELINENFMGLARKDCPSSSKTINTKKKRIQIMKRETQYLRLCNLL